MKSNLFVKSEKEVLKTELLSFYTAAYNSSRTELLGRINTRESAVRTYITSVSMIIAASSLLNEVDKPWLLFVLSILISLVSLSLSHPIAVSERKISSIGVFLAEELVPEIEKISGCSKIVEWEVSNSLKESAFNTRSMWYNYYILLFLIPQLVIFISIYYLYKSGSLESDSANRVVVLGAVFVFLSIFFTYKNLRDAKERRNEDGKKRGHKIS